MAEETIGEIVRRARGNLTLDAFAAQIGTSRQRVIAWEKNRSIPSPPYAKIIGEMTGVDPAVIHPPREDPLAVALDQYGAALKELAGLIRSDVSLDRQMSARLAKLEERVASFEATVLRSLQALEQLVGRRQPRARPEANEQG